MLSFPSPLTQCCLQGLKIVQANLFVVKKKKNINKGERGKLSMYDFS